MQARFDAVHTEDNTEKSNDFNLLYIEYYKVLLFVRLHPQYSLFCRSLKQKTNTVVVELIYLMYMYL